MIRRRQFASAGGDEIRDRIVRVGVGVGLVVLVVFAAVTPVLGIVASAAAVGPLVDVPWTGVVSVIVLGLGLSSACLALAWRTLRRGFGWLLVSIAVLFALVAALGPLVITADAAVDRARDVVPLMVELLREFA